MTHRILSALIFSVLCCCGVVAQTGKPLKRAISATQAQDQLLSQPELQSAHVGIYVYDDSLKKDISNYQDNKYFTPASNTKLFTLYAGLKYLGDSVPGIQYINTDTALFVFPTGDPTLLDPAFSSQPVIDFLKPVTKKIYILANRWQEDAVGKGWSADDYNEDFSAERSPLPVYTNTLHWIQQKDEGQQKIPGMESAPFVYSLPEVNWKILFAGIDQKSFAVKRRRNENIFEISVGKESNKELVVPFITDTLSAAIELLKDTLGKTLLQAKQAPYKGLFTKTIFSRPVDSIFIPMMYESINLYAEQTLLMLSYKELGVMNDEKMISSLLQHDLADLPQQPVWTDGSGQSRYNLFSPQDMVMILSKMKNEFGMERMKKILPTGGQGTLQHYYRSDSGSIYAKTGSIGGVFCISGYLYSAKNHLLFFSVMINNSKGNGAAIRKDVEQYVEAVRRAN